MKTIFQAVIESDLDEIRKLRDQGQIDINALNEQGDSALTLAIKKGNLATFLLLLEFKGICVNQETYTIQFQNERYPENPLYLSTRLNRPQMVQALLGRGADPTRKLGRPQVTPLMVAAANGFTECMKLLLATGKGIQLRNSLGHTALELAAKGGNSAALGLLIPHATYRELLSAAFFVNYNKHPEIAQLLRACAARVSIQEQEHQSTSSQTVPKIKAQKLIGKSASHDKNYGNLVKTVRTLEARLKIQGEVVKTLQEELKSVKEAQQSLTTATQLAPDLTQTTAEAMQTHGPILQATKERTEPDPVIKGASAGRVPPAPGMIQPVSTIQPMTEKILKPIPRRVQSTTNSAQPVLQTVLPDPGKVQPRTSNQTRSSFFALTNRPLPHNELSNPAHYALSPSQSKP